MYLEKKGVRPRNYSKTFQHFQFRELLFFLIIIIIVFNGMKDDIIGLDLKYEPPSSV